MILFSFLEAFKLNFPSMSVVVPLVLLIITLTPTSGSFVLKSITVPLIVWELEIILQKINTVK